MLLVTLSSQALTDIHSPTLHLLVAVFLPHLRDPFFEARGASGAMAARKIHRCPAFTNSAPKVDTDPLKPEDL